MVRVTKLAPRGAWMPSPLPNAGGKPPSRMPWTRSTHTVSNRSLSQVVCMWDGGMGGDGGMQEAWGVGNGAGVSVFNGLPQV